jgi:hypothetical protein
LGLLGSSHAGERDAAGLAADRLVRQVGLTWFDIVSPPVVEQPVHVAVEPAEPDNWRNTIAKCQARPELLSEWETAFLRKLPAFPRLSDKQENILREIAARVLAQ